MYHVYVASTQCNFFEMNISNGENFITYHMNNHPLNEKLNK